MKRNILTITALFLALAGAASAREGSTTARHGVVLTRNAGVCDFERVVPLDGTRMTVVARYADGHEQTVLNGNFYNGDPAYRLSRVEVRMIDFGHEVSLCADHPVEEGGGR